MKHLSFLFLALALSLSTFAQFGIKAGANASQFRSGYEPDNKLKTSVVGGLYAGIPLSNAVALQIEAIYMCKGSLINRDNAGGRFRMNMNHVHVPVVFRLGAGQFKIEAGGYASYLAKMNIAKFNYENEITVYDENDFQRYDFGAVGGIAYRWDWITFNARYEHGLKTVGYRNQPLGDYPRNQQKKNQNFVLSMEIPLTRKR